MIYLFAGDDAKKKRAAYEKFLKGLPKGTEVLSVSRNNFDRMQIESLYSGSGLFFAKSAITFESILDHEETRDFILDKLPLIADSENDFIFLEGKLLKPILDKFKKAKAEIYIFELVKDLPAGRQGKKEKFNSFLLANALGAKNRFDLWLAFRQAMDAGVALEELAGVLFWKAKDMLLKKSYGKFTKKELEDFASKLSYLLPQARQNGPDAEEAFEQFILEAF